MAFGKGKKLGSDPNTTRLYHVDSPRGGQAYAEGSSSSSTTKSGKAAADRYVVKEQDGSFSETGKTQKQVYTREEYLSDYQKPADPNNTLRVGDKSTSKKSTKSKTGKEIREERYHEKYLPTQTRGNFDAPLLGPDGLPINAATTNVSLDVKLKRHFNSVERLMETRIFREKTDERMKKVVYDIRNIMADVILMIEQRGTDQQVLNILKDMSSFRSDISSDADLRVMVSDWRSTIVKMFTGDQSKDIITTSGKLISDVRNSDSIIRLFGEGAKFFQMLVLDRNNPMLDQQRELVFELFYKSFGILSTNPYWQEFITKSRAFNNEVKETGQYEYKNHSAKIQSVAKNQNLSSMGNNTKLLLQSLIRDKSVADVDKVVQYGNETWVEMKKNPSYSTFFHDFQQISLEIMDNPQLVEDPATRKVIRDMYNRFEVIVTESRNTVSLQKFASESGRLKDGILTDELNSRFFQHIRQLAQDLQPLEKGQSTLDTKFLGQFKMLLVPYLLEEFRTISIPPQQGMTPSQISYRVGNINLSSVELLPENIHFEIAHKTNADPYTLSLIDPDTIVWVELTAIRARLEKVQWAYEKHTGIKIRDSGLADIFLDGRGMRVGAEIRILAHGRHRLTQVLDSYCHIDKFSFKLYDCKHTFLYKVVGKMFMKKIKRAIEKAVAEKLAQQIALTDAKMVGKYHTAKQDHLRRKARFQQRVDTWKQKSKAYALKRQQAKKNSNHQSIFSTLMGVKKHNQMQPNVAKDSGHINTPMMTNTNMMMNGESNVPGTIHTTTQVPVTQYAAEKNTKPILEKTLEESPSHPNYVGPSSN